MQGRHAVGPQGSPPLASADATRLVMSASRQRASAALSAALRPVTPVIAGWVRAWRAGPGPTPGQWLTRHNVARPTIARTTSSLPEKLLDQYIEVHSPPGRDDPLPGDHREMNVGEPGQRPPTWRVLSPSLTTLGIHRPSWVSHSGL
jgi:hypothetical protein